MKFPKKTTHKTLASKNLYAVFLRNSIVYLAEKNINQLHKYICLCAKFN